MNLKCTPAAKDVENQIRQLEQVRMRALAEQDYDTLEAMFEAHGIYCHSSGRVDALGDYLRNLRNGASQYVAPRYEIESVFSSDSAAHVWGRFTTKVIRRDDTIELDVLGGVTWMLIDGDWKIVAVQTTRRS